MPLPSPENGIADTAEIEKGTFLYRTNYRCDDGYRLEGDTFRQCNPTSSVIDPKTGKLVLQNKWTGKDPVCIEGMLIFYKHINGYRTYS